MIPHLPSAPLHHSACDFFTSPNDSAFAFSTLTSFGAYDAFTTKVTNGTSSRITTSASIQQLPKLTAVAPNITTSAPKLTAITPSLRHQLPVPANSSSNAYCSSNTALSNGTHG
ncbi:hypothetical protein L3X38_044893 [Prunus dulcis]|uniref:Uncharacterized protein n=1 Tax=Prunus dulcis TaxID=3755 RepID=A0AAD4V176_PRUDU|nr:hypothetical protein L3X38_044893 [Prunus dulcis]